MGSRPYVVRQGDYTGRLATRFGVDADTLWSDPANRELAQRRPNRDVLAPGDILHVPEVPEAARPVRAHQTNRYRARVATTSLSLIFREGRAPLPNERCAIHGIAGEPREARTDGEGRLRVEVP